MLLFLPFFLFCFIIKLPVTLGLRITVSPAMTISTVERAVTEEIVTDLPTQHAALKVNCVVPVQCEASKFMSQIRHFTSYNLGRNLFNVNIRASFVTDL